MSRETRDSAPYANQGDASNRLPERHGSELDDDIEDGITPHQAGVEKKLQEDDLHEYMEDVECLGDGNMKHVVNGESGPFDEVQFEGDEATESRWYSPIVNLFNHIIPYGGLASNCFSLGSITLGAGVVSMPNSFRTSGILMALIYLVILNCLAIYSFVLIGYVARRTGCKTYEAAGDLLFGRGCGYFVGLMQVLAVVGASIAFIKVIGNMMERLIATSTTAPAYFRTSNGNHLLVVIVWACTILPFLLPKKVNTIRYVSTAGVLSVIYLVVCIVVHCGLNDCKLGMRDSMKLFTTGNQAISGLSIFIFAYLCQPVAFNIYWEQRPRPSVKQLITAASIIMCIITSVYILTGMCGYFDFADATLSPILSNFDPMTDIYILVAYIGMFIKLIASSAIVMVPIRNYFYYCAGWDVDETPYYIHIPVVVVMGGILLVAGLFIPKVDIAFGLVGSICGSFIAFIFPALMWMYCGEFSIREKGILTVLACYFMLTVGVIAFVWGTVVTIYDTVQSEKSK